MAKAESSKSKQEAYLWEGPVGGQGEGEQVH